jgi:1-acyl-sn-glycerol-3-phosphate acyltransferase
MTWFKGHLYCGSTRGNLVFLRKRNPPPQFPIFPIRCPDNPYDVDLRAQIWRYDPTTELWENVYRAPMVPSIFGEMVPREFGYRGMAVFQGKSDKAPTLYVCTFSPTRSSIGALILRSEDGLNFEPVTGAGLGLFDRIVSFRFLEIFRDKIYTAPIGSVNKNIDPKKFVNSDCNSTTYPMVFESDDPASGQWWPVCAPHFNNPNNTVIFHVTACNDHLYAGTANIKTGFQVWKTAAQGDPPYEWKNVVNLGAYRGKLNQGTCWLTGFKGAVYLGTGIQDGGYDRTNQIGPAAGEVIRINANDTWDLVVGTARLTPYGLKLPTSGLKPGFDNFFNGYLWQLCAHDDWLYVATLDWSVYLRFAPIHLWPPAIQKIVEAMGVEETIAEQGGFDLWKTNDGDHWYPVTLTGFGNPYNCAVRRLASTPLGLAVGTVNSFGPEVAVKQGNQWQYVPNPRGGCEVWLGSPYPAPAEAAASNGHAPVQIPAAAADTKPFVDPQKPHYVWQANKEPRIELTPKQLRWLKQRIDVGSVMPEILDFARDYHSLVIEGANHLPREGPILFVSNHTGTVLMVESTFLTEDCLLTLHILNQQMRRPARLLVSAKYYEKPSFFKASREVIERLGYVPITLENGVRLLEMGEPVLMYPEGQASKPAYQLLPFFWGFAKMAWITRSPIVPVLLIGPHESRLRIDVRPQHSIVMLHQPKPLKTQYKVIFLEPIHVRDHVHRLEDKVALTAFSEEVRHRMQAVLNREMLTRPLARAAQRLQDKYGVPY